MDGSIIREFAELHVLTPYDFQKMDELVQDLTNALESSCAAASLGGAGAQRKRRSRKRRPIQLTSTLLPGPHLAEGNPKQISHDSVSSAEDDGKGPSQEPLEMTQQSDSDGAISSNGRRFVLNAHFPVPNFPGSFAESDSVNENFSPVRPHRRRRKFKRMAIDPSPIAMSSSPGSSGVHERLPLLHGQSPIDQSVALKPKIYRLAKHKGDAEGICRTYGFACLTPGGLCCGKRKRNVRERSVELADLATSSTGENGAGLNVGSAAPTTGCATLFWLSDSSSPNMMDDGGGENGMERMENLSGYQLIETSSSSFSSHESDAGVYTNDEGREGDDEQSDFYHEIGPVCGIPSVHPWWDADNLVVDEDPDEMDPNFNTILKGSFQHMTPESQNAFRERVSKLTSLPGREIRAGRRRLRDRRPGFSIKTSVNEKISKFLQNPEQNELRLHPMRKKEIDQLSHLASLYSLNMRKEGTKKKNYPVLTKTQNTMQTVNMDSMVARHSHSAVSDIKRLRKTPPNSPLSEGFVGGGADPIPENNVGNRMLRSMGWEPGTGLGSNRSGIVNPVCAYIRTKYQGLGHTRQRMEQPSASKDS